MCARFSLTLPPRAIAAYFGCRAEPGARPDIAPTQAIPVVRQTKARGRECAMLRWGLIPAWVKDPAGFSTLINARAETAAEKPSFRAAMRQRRCLVIADGFYEWAGEKGKKQPFHIRRAEPGEPLAFAALWESWRDAEGNEIESAAILTTAANADVAPLHERMPAILDADDLDAWLDCERVPLEEVIGLLQPAPDGLLAAVPVNRRSASPRRTPPDSAPPRERAGDPSQGDLPLGP